MKSKIFTFTTALSLLVALAVPVQLAAQDSATQNHKPKHHHYKLIDLGSTFGGPRSYFNPGSGNDLDQFASVLNSGGTVAGFAETA